MKIRHMLAAVAAALAMVTSVHAAPFSNGSFELTLVGDTFRYIPTDPDTTTIPGWTVYGGILGVEQWSQSNMHLGGFTDAYATDGDQWVAFTQSATNRVSQTFDTVVGGTYAVRFDEFYTYGSGGTLGTTRGINAIVGTETNSYGVLAPSVAPVGGYGTGTGAGIGGFERHQFEFTATSTSSTLTFMGSLFGNWFPTAAPFGASVDNVVIVQVPEPATIGLLVCAGTLLLVRTHRRS